MNTYRAIKDPKPKVIIIRCSDPRFKPAFRDFTGEHLRLLEDEFLRINIAGGPAALAHPRAKKYDHDFILGQIKFFMGHFPSIKEVIIIGHQDCGYYKTIDEHPDTDDKEKKDLPRAVATLSRELPEASVKAFYASFVNEDKTEIVFEKI